MSSYSPHKVPRRGSSKAGGQADLSCRALWPRAGWRAGRAPPPLWDASKRPGEAPPPEAGHRRPWFTDPRPCCPASKGMASKGSRQKEQRLEGGQNTAVAQETGDGGLSGQLPATPVEEWTKTDWGTKKTLDMEQREKLQVGPSTFWNL